jgi:hypothetical protein
MVGRKNAHYSVGINGLQNVRGKPNRRRRIALRGLGQYLLSWNLRQLLYDLVAKMIVGKNPDSLGWKQGPQPIHGLLD